MSHLPTGTVTFLCTDIEGSTRLVQHIGDAHSERVFADYRRLLQDAVEASGGHLWEDQGESLFFVFQRAGDALLGAVAAQRTLAVHPWPGRTALRVRMGLPTGEPVSTRDGYVGVDVHRVARICQAGHGGQILLSETTHDLIGGALPEGISLRNLGEHRLKDLTRPVDLFQVAVADLPSNFPPLRALGLLPNNLPIQLASFVGRKREIAEVKSLLSTTRLLTLTGTGGVGKTRLALQVAADLTDEFSDGVWLVELAALSDPVLVAQAVASTLNVHDLGGRPIQVILTDFLQRRQLLLVLDNCEHLLLASAHLADTLLRSCPRVQILATSREGLSIAGELTFTVPPLSVPDPRDALSLNDLVQNEAIRLFVERAKFALPTFKLTNRNALALAQVCYHLDGMPLAIELAAARVKVLSAEQIAERMDDRFRLLTRGSRTALPRHQTLRAAMDWSYDLLTGQERTILCRLSAFAGGWTLEAAEAVCGEQGICAFDVVDLLTRLVDKSLVIAEEQDGDVRYRLLETVRQYGWERLLAAGESADVQMRHRGWYLALAERAEPELHGPNQGLWLDRLETDHDNLRAALASSLGEQAGTETGLRLAAALHWFWFLRGYINEGFGWLERGLARPGVAAAPIRAKALIKAGHLAWRLGNIARAIAMHDEGLSLSREVGDKKNLTLALWFSGISEILRGDYRQAATLYGECLQLARQSGQERYVAAVLAEQGFMEQLEGDYEVAARLYEESLNLFRRLGDTWHIAYCFRLLGILAQLQLQYKEAEAFYKESLTLCRSLKEKWVTVECLEGLAGIAARIGRPERAAHLFGAADNVRQAIGLTLNPWEQAHHGREVALVRATLGRAAFSVAFAEGQAMALEEAVESVLGAET